MGEPEPFIPEPRQNTGHDLPAADASEDGMARCDSEVCPHRRSDAAAAPVAAAGERSAKRRPSVSPQLSQRREVDSLSSSATDWCVETSRSARLTGYNTIYGAIFYRLFLTILHNVCYLLRNTI